MKLRSVEAPFIASPDGGRGDAPAAWTEGETVGALQPIASSVLMKVLYGARAARWDLLKAVQLLATRVTKWSRECDKALHRLMCYINCTVNHCLSGFVGDGPSALRLRLYADADFAGDRPEFKSTSGVFLAMVGPNTFFPLAAKAQKQTAVAHSTVEAEIVSAGFAVRTVGLPALDLWETVLRRSVALTLIEDNESTAAIIRSGRNPTMRHLVRTQGVNVSWLHDLYLKKVFGVVYSRTEAQCADVFTKTFSELPKWQQAVRLIGIAKPDAPPYVPPEPGPLPETVIKKKTNGQTVSSDEAAAGVQV